MTKKSGYSHTTIWMPVCKEDCFDELPQMSREDRELSQLLAAYRMSVNKFKKDRNAKKLIFPKEYAFCILFLETLKYNSDDIRRCAKRARTDLEYYYSLISPYISNGTLEYEQLVPRGGVKIKDYVLAFAIHLSQREDDRKFLQNMYREYFEAGFMCHKEILDNIDAKKVDAELFVTSFVSEFGVQAKNKFSKKSEDEYTEEFGKKCSFLFFLMYIMDYEMYSVTDPTVNPVAISFYRLVSLFSGTLNFQIFEDVPSDKFIKRYLRNTIKEEYRDRNVQTLESILSEGIILSRLNDAHDKDSLMNFYFQAYTREASMNNVPEAGIKNTLNNISVFTDWIHYANTDRKKLFAKSFEIDIMSELVEKESNAVGVTEYHSEGIRSDSEILEQAKRENKSLVGKISYQKSLITELKIKERELRDSIKEKDSELLRLQNELTRLQKELESVKNDIQQQEMILDEEDASDGLTSGEIELMQDCRITIVGGHINVQTHIAEKVPGIRFLKAEIGSVDPSLIKNSDLVVFFANHLSHAKYNTVKQIATNHSIPYIYVNSNNVNAALKKMARFLFG